MSLCSSCIIVSQLHHTMFVYSVRHQWMHLVANFLSLSRFQSSFRQSASIGISLLQLSSAHRSLLNSSLFCFISKEITTHLWDISRDNY